MSTQRFVRHSLLLIVIEMMAKALGVVLFALVARFLGARELGLFAFATAVANFIAIPARFGFETLVQRDVGRHPAGTRACFQDIGLLKGLISLTVLVLYLTALKMAGQGDLTVMALVACFTLVYSFMEFINSFFRANQRPELELAVRSFFSVSNLLLGIVVLYSGWRLAGVVSSQLLCAGLAVILGARILLRLAQRVKYHWDRQVLKHYLAAAAPFAGILVALYFSNQVGVLILTPLAGTEEVGYFAAASRLFDAMTLIPAAVMGAFLPMMSQLYVQTLGGFVRTLNFTMKYLFILTAPLMVLTIILARQIIVFLYHQAFTPSIPALQILSCALLFSFWNCASESVLVARNREWPLLKLAWITAGIHVAANLLLIPRFTYLGACWAVLATQGLYSIILFRIFLRRYLSLSGLLRLLALPALSAAIMSAAIFPLRDGHLLISISTGLLVYLGALLALGVINRGELDRLQSMVAIRCKQGLR